MISLLSKVEASLTVPPPGFQVPMLAFEYCCSMVRGRFGKPLPPWLPLDRAAAGSIDMAAVSYAFDSHAYRCWSLFPPVLVPYDRQRPPFGPCLPARFPMCSPVSQVRGATPPPLYPHREFLRGDKLCAGAKMAPTPAAGS